MQQKEAPVRQQTGGGEKETCAKHTPVTPFFQLQLAVNASFYLVTPYLASVADLLIWEVAR